MKPKSDTELDGDRVRLLTSMPEYRDTIGKWLSDETAETLHALRRAKGDELLSLQGRYDALSTLHERIAGAIAASDKLRERRLLQAAKKQQKEKQEGIPYE